LVWGGKKREGFLRRKGLRSFGGSVAGKREKEPLYLKERSRLVLGVCHRKENVVYTLTTEKLSRCAGEKKKREGGGSWFFRKKSGPSFRTIERGEGGFDTPSAGNNIAATLFRERGG